MHASRIIVQSVDLGERCANHEVRKIIVVQIARGHRPSELRGFDRVVVIDITRTGCEIPAVPTSGISEEEVDISHSFWTSAKGISDIIVGQGIINLDFADVRTIMSETGMALMGTGIASGDNRSVEAAQKAISSPLLEDISIEGAKGLLINITGGSNMTLSEINEATTLVQKEAHEEANIIWGMVIDEAMREEIRVTVIATGFGKTEEKALARFKGRGAPISISMRENSLRESPLREGILKENRDLPTFMRRVKVNERYAELKLVESPDFSTEDEDRFDIPTFLRKQAD